MKIKRIREENDNIIATDFAKIIYNLRLEHNLTQKGLADLIQVSDRTISKWENGQTVPDLINIKSICDELGVSPSSIVHSKRTMKDHFKIFNKGIAKLINICFKNMFFIFFIIAFVLLLVYFINNYNSMSIYLLKYDSEDININHGYFVESKKANILVIDDISIKNNYDPNDLKLELYTYINGDKYIIYNSNNLDDIYLEEFSGYHNFFNSEVLINMKKGLYMDVYSKDKHDKEIHYSSVIDLEAKFSNTKLSYATNNEKEEDLFLSNDYYYPTMNNIAMANFDVDFNNEKDVKVFGDKNTKFEELGFVYNGSEEAYVKKDDNGVLMYLINFNKLSLEYYNDNYTFKISYKFKSELMNIKKYKNNVLIDRDLCFIEPNGFSCNKEFVDSNKLTYLLRIYKELDNSLNVE